MTRAGLRWTRRGSKPLPLLAGRPALALAGVVLLGLVAGAALAQGGAEVAPGTAAAADEGLRVAKGLSHAFAAVARKVRPAVVNISTTRLEQRRRSSFPSMFRNLFPDMEGFFTEAPREIHSLGSGVIVRGDGVVITNWHVIQGAQQITVKLCDDRELPAQVLGQDAYTDLAVLKVEGADLPCIGYGDSEGLEVGEWVIAVGSPLGLAQTVTAGIVSAKGRKNMGISGYEDFIQTDAAINPGNSGGPLLNLDGGLVGINSAIASEGGGYDGVCFAIPTTIVQPVVAALLADGAIHRPWIGVTGVNVNEGVAQQLGLEEAAGVLIGNVVRNGPAQQAQLQPGDVLVKWQGEDLSTVEELTRKLQASRVGDEVSFSIIRQGRRFRGSLTVAERPGDVQTKGIL
jgi:serine protease Do